jgi:hypothetical protein
MAKLYPLNKVGAIGEEFFVPVGRHAELPGDEPFFHFYQFGFGKPAAPVGNVYVISKQFLKITVPDTVQDAIFQKFNVFVSWFIFYIVFHGDNGIAFAAKPKGYLGVMLIQVSPYNAFLNKINMSSNFVGLEQNMPLGQSDLLRYLS